MNSPRHIATIVALFAGPLIVYALTLPHTITLEDAGLFQMVCRAGGISHPPGYPTFTMLCQGLSALPFFPEDASGLNLLSALFASLTVPILYQCVRLLTQDEAIAVITALAYAFSNTFWSQAIIVEVYTLAALFFVITWWLTIKFVQSGASKWLYFAAFSVGLSLTNHWPLMILASPAIVATACVNTPALVAFLTRPLNWVVCMALFLAGLTPYLQLLQSDPVTAVYGGVTSPAELAKYIMRSAYEDQRLFAELSDRLSYAVWLMKETLSQFGYLGAPLVAYGAFLSFRHFKPANAIALLLLFLSGTLLLNMLINFRYEYFWQAIYKPYPIVAYIAPAVWFALGAVHFTRFIAARLLQPQLSPVVLGLLIVTVLVGNLGQNFRANNPWLEQYGRAVLATLPPDAVFFVRGDFEVGVFGYLHYLRGIRPDIELRSWNNLVFANRLSTDVANGPDAQAALQTFLAESERPVIVGTAPLHSFIDLGAFNQYVKGNVRGAARHTEQGPIMDYVIELYSNGLIKDPHELNVAYYMLIQFTRHHTALARVTELDDQEFNRLVNLQQTFPGQLATMEAAVRFGQYPLDDPDLLSIAQRALSTMPEHVPLDSQAVFFEYFGRILASHPNRHSEAKSAFMKSLAILPSVENKTLCAMLTLFPEEAPALQVRFPDSQCVTESHRATTNP